MSSPGAPAPTALKHLASVVRSKNAGPLCLTVDVFFSDRIAYERAVVSYGLSANAIAVLYGVQAGQVRRFDLPEIMAIKLAMPRTLCAGDPGDGDVYGAQQHAPMLEVLL
ncbi:MAG: DUF4387 domain-containing protein [Betaproteobacteria bacterium]|nr:DUF4387 domain-containing protein [Betaproteobacteria bacterium]